MAAALAAAATTTIAASLPILSAGGRGEERGGHRVQIYCQQRTQRSMMALPDLNR